MKRWQTIWYAGMRRCGWTCACVPLRRGETQRGCETLHRTVEVAERHVERLNARDERLSRATEEPKPILMVVDGHKVSLHSECKRRGLDYSVAWYFVRQRGMTAKQALARLSFRRAT